MCVHGVCVYVCVYVCACVRVRVRVRVCVCLFTAVFVHLDVLMQSTNSEYGLLDCMSRHLIQVTP